MKCTCKNCSGSGHVPCDDCGGNGKREYGIERVVFDKTERNFAELVELQEDAKLAIRNADLLIGMKPHRHDSYAAQREAVLATINAAADKLTQR